MPAAKSSDSQTDNLSSKDEPEPENSASEKNTSSKNASRGLSAQRRKARHYAVQALYQWYMAGSTLDDIEAYFVNEYDMQHTDMVYFRELLHQVPARLSEIESAFTPLLDRDIGELDPIERAVLRMSGYELLARLDVPYRVIINEGVSLAKKFGASESHKFINGVLDKLARKLRSVEVANR